MVISFLRRSGRTCWGWRGRWSPRLSGPAVNTLLESRTSERDGISDSELVWPWLSTRKPICVDPVHEPRYRLKNPHSETFHLTDRVKVTSKTAKNAAMRLGKTRENSEKDTWFPKQR